MVKETGWSLEAIDALTLEEFHEYLNVQDGIAKAHKSNRKGR